MRNAPSFAAVRAARAVARGELVRVVGEEHALAVDLVVGLVGAVRADGVGHVLQLRRRRAPLPGLQVEAELQAEARRRGQQPLHQTVDLGPVRVALARRVPAHDRHADLCLPELLEMRLNNGVVGRRVGAQRGEEARADVAFFRVVDEGRVLER